jgi:sugar lactone lactonase YvrE
VALAAALSLWSVTISGQGPLADAMKAHKWAPPIHNDLPNPYERVAPWGELPPGTAKWAAVAGVEQGPDGNIYVVHRCANNSCFNRPEPPILKLSPEGKFLKAWGENMYVFPHSLHVDREGNLWVPDLGPFGADRAAAEKKGGGGHQVFKFSPDGKLLMTLGKPGVASDAPGMFNQPTFVYVAPNGDFFVSEGHGSGNNRVQKFAKDGTFIKMWGKTGAGSGEMNWPHVLAMDSRGRLFVGDRLNNRIQIFDQDGNYLDEWRQFGRPSGIYITEDDTIYVADSESWDYDNPGWKKGIRVGSAKDGSVKYFIEDFESTRMENSGAEGVGVDSKGNVYGAVVRRQMLERHVKKP